MRMSYFDVVMIVLMLLFFSSPISEARKLMEVKSDTLVISPPTGSSSESKIWYGMKPKGPIPPSGPSNKRSPDPPLQFQMMPKTIPQTKSEFSAPPPQFPHPWYNVKPKEISNSNGAPLPPSGPSKGHNSNGAPLPPSGPSKGHNSNGAPLPPSGPSKGHNSNGAPLPPSGPSKGHNSDFPTFKPKGAIPDPQWSEMKIKGPVPPSGPSDKRSPDGPEQKPNGVSISQSEEKWYGMKPKGPIPPSGPSNKRSPDAPEPKLNT